MASVKRLYITLTKRDFKQLRELSLKEHKDFFKRNPHLKSIYYNSLIGICLCQGAASHVLNHEVGIKDFDIWHFYKDKSVKFPYRAHKRIEGGYKGKPVDFLKRAIPRHICNSYSNNPGKAIIEYLCEKNTKTKNLLLEKAIIGLFPNKIFGKILWRGCLK